MYARNKCFTWLRILSKTDPIHVPNYDTLHTAQYNLGSPKGRDGQDK